MEKYYSSSKITHADDFLVSPEDISLGVILWYAMNNPKRWHCKIGRITLK